MTIKGVPILLISYDERFFRTHVLNLNNNTWELLMNLQAVILDDNIDRDILTLTMTIRIFIFLVDDNRNLELIF